MGDSHSTHTTTATVRSAHMHNATPRHKIFEYSQAELNVELSWLFIRIGHN